MKKTTPINSGEQGAYDILKLILSVLIIAINSLNIGLGEVSFYVTEYVARLAVPLFFCMSAYFLFQNYATTDKDIFKKKFFRYEKNLLKIYIIWNVIYLIVDVIPEWYRDKSSIVDILKYMYYVAIGIQYKELWYIGATIVGAFLIWILLKKLNIKTIVVISLLLYIVALICFTYFPVTEPVFDKIPILKTMLILYNKVFSTFRNGIFDGFPFMALGAYLAFNKDKRYNTATVSAVFVISMVLLFIETRFLRGVSTPYHGLMLFLYTATPSAFILVGKIRLKSSDKYKYIRKISTYNFLVQEIAFILKDKICDVLNISIGNFVQYIISVFICFILSIVIFLIKNSLQKLTNHR